MVKKEDGGRSRSNESEPRKPRVQRASADSERAFKERRERSEQGIDQPRPRGRTGGRAERPKQEDNVNLFLSPRMMELAEELAQAEKMNLRQYLTEALKYILLAHGKRLGATDKYVTEFVSQNNKKIATWRSDSGVTADGAPDEQLDVEVLANEGEGATEGESGSRPEGGDARLRYGRRFEGGQESGYGRRPEG
ncbi:MAG: hypothetical protein JST44_24490, partial [Cyanobacteria bacterium SZAS LIN-5]|nr:hypothetical protein [Cyanobacteria bacterium SZAS LIN-5]